MSMHPGRPTDDEQDAAAEAFDGVAVMCSWCHTMSTDEAWPWCWSCGHRADVLRAKCDCPKCWQPDDLAADAEARLLRQAKTKSSFNHEPSVTR